MTFAAGLSQHPVPAHAIGEVVGQVLEQLGGDEDAIPVDLAVLFVSPHHIGAIEDVASAVRNLLRPRVLLGCSAAAVIGGNREVEEESGISLLVGSLPGSRLVPMQLRVQPTHSGPALIGWDDTVHGGTLLTLIDPFSVPGDGLLHWLNANRPDVQVIGGLASAARGPGGNRLIFNDTIATEGAVCVLLEDVVVDTVVSQGCRPIGQPWVVTRATSNVVEELAGRPALARLSETVEGLSEDDRVLLQHGLHVGIVVDEHRTEFERGDFIVRNVLGIDHERGAVAIGDVPEIGQTVQFHARDAASADEDLRELIGMRANDGHVEAALLFTCNGRGRHLFGAPDHDASVIETLLGPLPLAGMFCAGELGPVGGRNFLHGFTASIALLRTGAREGARTMPGDPGSAA